MQSGTVLGRLNDVTRVRKIEETGEMVSYGRDAIWDAATWADIDQAVLDTANRVRVARKVFRTETVGAASPGWVSGSEIDRRAGVLQIPNGRPLPLEEISKTFALSPVQAETEGSLRIARSLASDAARELALDEDNAIFRDQSVSGPEGMRLDGLRCLAWREPAKRVSVYDGPIGAVRKADELTSAAETAHVTINRCLNNLAARSWVPPYALVLGANLYEAVWWRRGNSSGDAPGTLLENRVSQILLSATVQADEAIVLSLAGDPITIHVVEEASTTFMGQQLVANKPAYVFRVSERIQLVTREPDSIRLIVPSPAAREAAKVEAAAARQDEKTRLDTVRNEARARRQAARNEEKARRESDQR